ncbi:MAG TPA: NAD(P)H-quinone oxidoreductase [Casimicrobiaceae bacterium]|nr:NAD(P)H-quinone oxidoreductase [Casimicrobiaceae bacterium]
MPLPISMRYIDIPQPGPPSVMAVAQGPLPVAKPGEVLIEVAYAGVNRPDCLQRAGAYPPPPDASPIAGLEVSGRVAALGEGVTEWKVGDDVCALTPGGGYAEYCTTPAGFCLPPPRGPSLREAACVPETYFTVWYNLFARIRFEPGESVLIHGGTSGIGLTAIQLCKAFGAIVYTTAGSDDKVAFCRGMGADHAINYKTQDWSAEVWKLTGKKGVNVVLDMVGGDYVARNIRSLAPDGRLSQIAFLKDSTVELDMRAIMMKRLVVTGSTLRASPAARKVALARELREKVWPLFAQGKLRIVIAETFPLAEVARAHALMESGALIGKIALGVRER